MNGLHCADSSTFQILFYKNVVTDESIRYNWGDGKRGSLENVAVKLYGTSYIRAHPDIFDLVDPQTMFHPWFEEDRNDLAFGVSDYYPVGGGVNKDDMGTWTTNSIDLAVLTVDTDKFFKSIEVDIDKQLLRLEWVTEEKHRITGMLFD